MSDTHVVWMQVNGNSTDVWAHDIMGNKTWNLSDHESSQIDPRISEGRVVWTDLRKGSGNYYGSHENADVYMYDFATEELKRITAGNWVQMYPDISGDRIVWQDYRACDYPNNQSNFSNVDVWMYDLKTGKEHQLTSLEGSETNVQISGDKLFYTRWTRTDPKVFAVFVQDLKALGF